MTKFKFIFSFIFIFIFIFFVLCAYVDYQFNELMLRLEYLEILDKLMQVSPNLEQLSGASPDPAATSSAVIPRQSRLNPIFLKILDWFLYFISGGTSLALNLLF